MAAGKRPGAAERHQLSRRLAGKATLEQELRICDRRAATFLALAAAA
jgi:hypothetical protein